MTLIYIPTEITSVEHAASLPIGTIAIHADSHIRSVFRLTDNPVGPWDQDMRGYRHDAVVGYLALVPVEAEAARSEERRGYHLIEATTGDGPMVAYITEEDPR